MLSLFFACYDVTAEKKMSHFVLKNDMFVAFEKCCLLFFSIMIIVIAMAMILLWL